MKPATDAPLTDLLAMDIGHVNLYDGQGGYFTLWSLFVPSTCECHTCSMSYGCRNMRDIEGLPDARFFMAMN